MIRGIYESVRLVALRCIGRATEVTSALTAGITMIDLHEDPRLEASMKAWGEALSLSVSGRASKINRQLGFALLVFDSEPNGAILYASSANLQDMLKVMREFIEKQQ